MSQIWSFDRPTYESSYANCRNEIRKEMRLEEDNMTCEIIWSLLFNVFYACKKESK